MLRYAAAAVLLLALTGCGGSDGARLTYPPANAVTEGAASVHQGDTVTIGSMFGCLDKPGKVTVLDVAPVKPVGMKVVGYGVRPNPFWKPSPGSGGQITVARETLSALDFPTSKTVDVACKQGGDEGAGFEFAAEVEKTTSGEAGASGWVVTYRTSDGDVHKLGYPIAVRLCNEKSAASKTCTNLKV